MCDECPIRIRPCKRHNVALSQTVGVRKSAEGRAPVAMQLVQLLQLVFFDTTEQPVNR